MVHRKQAWEFYWIEEREVEWMCIGLLNGKIK
jgi:hypothetical protein